MEGDADFEHARLLKIHTSVVVSARSVKEGFLRGRAFGISDIALQHSAVFVCLLILLLHANTPRLLHLFDISTPRAYLLLPFT